MSLYFIDKKDPPEDGSSYAPNPSQISEMNHPSKVLFLSINHSKCPGPDNIIFQCLQLGVVLAAQKRIAFLGQEKKNKTTQHFKISWIIPIYS